MIFEPRADNKLDCKLAKILKLLKIDDIPIVSIQEQTYFIGIEKLTLTLRDDYLIIVGSKQERLAVFLKENRSKLKDKLTLISLKMGGIGVKEIVKILIE